MLVLMTEDAWAELVCAKKSKKYLSLFKKE